MATALAAGFGLGFAVAAQIGPISLLCIRSTLRGRFAVGVAIGAGAAVIDALYAALGAAGASALLRIDTVRLALGIVGACVLAAIGLKTLHSGFRVRLGGESADEVASPRRAFLTSLGATASNPLTIVSWAAAFSAASTAALAGSASTAVALVAGVGVGTLTWFTILSGTLSIARRRIGTRILRIVDVVSGTAILGFAGLLGWRTIAHEP
jgi:putative LysE/RhtB family amino acid efflux pump